MTTTLFFRHALLPQGWAANVRITVAAGLIAAVAADAAPAPEDDTHGIALPGLPNLHSHTFQRAFAGLTEFRGAGQDNFWSWREQMYRFGLRMDPDDIEAVAAHAFVEMLEGGFTAVAEFHYLHHDPDGKPYADIAETASRIAAAAAATGIDLLLLPVFYAHANFGGLPPTPGQRRFICTLDQFETLYARCRTLAPAGIAPHSLRAVTPEELAALITLAGDAPFHIHIAEQTKEVADCVAWSGTPPVEWLLRHANVNARWCLIHATQASRAERAAIAQSGAVVGLCPITEANLGDGLFHAEDFAGAIGIGTDSNVQISAPDELRQLEYSQRLLVRQRNVMAAGPHGATATAPVAHSATATAIIQRTLAGGAQALGQPQAGLRPGAPANFFTLAPDRLGPLAADHPDTALSTAIFAARAPVIDGVWVRGKQLVQGGRHALADPIRARFHRVQAKLG